eukprot:s4248_g1.t1
MPYERTKRLPVTDLNVALSRQSEGLSDAAARNLKASVLAQLGNSRAERPYPGAVRRDLLPGRDEGVDLQPAGHAGRRLRTTAELNAAAASGGALGLRRNHRHGNAKGGKYVPLRRKGGPPVWQSAEWQKIIWHPAAFNDPSAMRVGLCLEPDEASKAQLQRSSSVRALTAEPKVFGKFLTETDVKDRFQSCLKTSPGRLVPQAEDGLGASPHVQSGGAGGARQPRRQGMQGPVRAAPNMADVQPVRPTARSDGSAAQNRRGRRSPS